MMKPNLTKLRANSEFASACLASCRKIYEQFERVKGGIENEFRGALAEQGHLLELAVNEAEALAWQTGFPQLFFPGLAMEKARGVANWYARQQALNRRRTPVALAVNK